MLAHLKTSYRVAKKLKLAIAQTPPFLRYTQSFFTMCGTMAVLGSYFGLSDKRDVFGFRVIQYGVIRFYDVRHNGRPRVILWFE